MSELQATTLEPIAKTILTENEAAEFLGLKPITLAMWRCNKRQNIPYVKLGSKLVRYRLEDLQAWMASRLVTN